MDFPRGGKGAGAGRYKTGLRFTARPLLGEREEVMIRRLAGQPAAVAHSQEGVRVDPLQQEKGKITINYPVDEFEVTFQPDIVDHINQGNDAQDRTEFQDHQRLQD